MDCVDVGWVYRRGSGIERFDLLHPRHPVSEASSPFPCETDVLGGSFSFLLISKCPVSQVSTPE